MQNSIQDTGVNKKKNIAKLMAVFIGVMLAMTFFSNTINNFTSPKVTCQRPARGQLVKEIRGNGEIRAGKILEFTLPLKMLVLSVDAKVGESVKKGQIIMTLDTSGIEDQIKDETAIYNQKQLNVEKCREELSEDGLKEYGLNIDAALRKLENARKKLENAQQLFEAGAEAEVNVKNAKSELADAEQQYEAAVINREKAISRSRRELESAENELELQKRKLSKLQKQMELAKISAPADGTINELNFSEGADADGSKPVYRLTDAASGFRFFAEAGKEEANHIAVGDMADLEIEALGRGSFEAMVAEIKDHEEQRGLKKIITFDIEAEGLMGGEKGVFELKKAIKDCSMLIPNSAVGQDSAGYFTYIVNERKGPLGNEYYAGKVRISVGGSDYMNTEVLSGISNFDMVIYSSDKPLSDGMRIMVNQK